MFCATIDINDFETFYIVIANLNILVFLVPRIKLTNYPTTTLS